MRFFGKLLFLCGLVISCATPTYRVESLNYPLAAIKDVVKEKLPGRLVTVSPNGREFYSEEFPLPEEYRQRSGSRGGKPIERAKAKIVILGDRRPYAVEVEVYREELHGGVYLTQGRVEDFESLIAKSIEKSLAKRQESTNLIDDFRPF